MHHRSILLACGFLLALLANSLSALAQQVDCTVQVNYEAVATSNKELLRDFANDVGNYVNNYQWGAENIPDKIKCTLNIFVQSVVGENKYSAQVFVGSSRPVYGSAKSSAVVRIFDETWEFTYLKERPLSHNPYTFSDLTSFLDFYMMLIVGYDSDTYDRDGGTPIFQKAADVASLGRSSGGKGWQPVTTGYSRLQLIEEVLTPKYEPVRSAYYLYHYAGLDSLASSPDRGYANILRAIDNVASVRRDGASRNLMIRTFFDTKYLELADLFATYPDRSVFIKFANVDPTHIKTYEEYRLKRSQ